MPATLSKTDMICFNNCNVSSADLTSISHKPVEYTLISVDVPQTWKCHHNIKLTFSSELTSEICGYDKHFISANIPDNVLGLGRALTSIDTIFRRTHLITLALLLQSSKVAQCSSDTPHPDLTLCIWFYFVIHLSILLVCPSHCMQYQHW